MKDKARGKAATFHTVLTVGLLLTLGFLSGCASAPKAPVYLSDEAKGQLGTVGIASARFPPTVELQTPAKGALAGAGRRAANWAGKAAGAVSPAPVCAGGGYAAAACGLAWLALLVGATVGGALVGGIAGTVDALPADTVTEAEAALTRSLSEARLQEDVRDRVFQIAQQRTLHPVVIVADRGPSTPEEKTTYDPVATHGINSILEISIFTVGLAGDWDINPPLRLAITGRSRMVRVSDGAEIHTSPLEYNSFARLFTEWAANEAQLYREELDRALTNLAGEIAVRYFLWLPPELDSPSGVAVDASGNLFVADARSHRIRKVEAATGLITTVAGTGDYGFAGDGGPATNARLASPTWVTVDANGNLFIADQDNRRIRKVEAETGLITTIAGTGESGFAGDGGPATSAQLAIPAGVAVDASGNLFIADQTNHRIRKREAETGLITTVAGTGESGFAGEGGPATSAQLSRPVGVAVDADGNILIADSDNHRVRKVEAATGLITTIAGTGESGFVGDGESATSAQLSRPVGVAVDTSGNLFIADQSNHRIRKVVLSTGIITTVTGGGVRPSVNISESDPAASPPPTAPKGVARNPSEAD